MSSADDATLSIGELSSLSGVSASTLRMWEARHGFPVPERLESGHRRYPRELVGQVREIARRRDAGMRLGAAVESVVAGQAFADLAGSSASASAAMTVFSELRRRHSGLPTHALRKSTLLAMSWAIEDEFCARARGAHVFGAFQRGPYYDAAAERWREVARIADATYVFADFEVGDHGAADATDSSVGPSIEPVRVALPAAAPMTREWAVVCDAAALPVALSAWELPGQQSLPDRDRVFESVWSVDAGAVRDAARLCAAVAVDVGASGAAGVAEALAAPPSRPADPRAVGDLFARIVSYLDADMRGRRQ